MSVVTEREVVLTTHCGLSAIGYGPNLQCRFKPTVHVPVEMSGRCQTSVTPDNMEIKVRTCQN